ncbi:MAG: hypothetical protein AAFR61_09375 [Bacteroidota bacterium]
MSSSEEMLALIDRYLSGKLPEAERAAFEARVAADSELAALLSSQALAEYAIRASLREEKKRRFEALWQEEDTTPVRPLLRYRPYLVAAVVVLLVALSLLFWLGRTEQWEAGEKMPAYLAEVSSMSSRASTGRDSLTRLDSLWIGSANAFNQEDFERAVRGLESLQQEPELQNLPKASFFAGLAYLHLYEQDPGQSERLRQAQSAFQKVSPLSTYGPQSTWYLSLAYWREGKLEKASALWQEMAAKPDHYRQLEAQELLEHTQP